MDNQDTIGIFASDWLRRGVSFPDQSQRRKAKPLKSSITFDSRLKISLFFFLLLPNKPDQKMTANDRNSLAKSALHSGRAGSCQETGREGNWTSVHQERRVWLMCWRTLSEHWKGNTLWKESCLFTCYKAGKVYRPAVQLRNYLQVSGGGQS